jgi:thioredoxin 1
MTIDIRTGALAIVALAFMGVSANAAEKMPFEKTKFAQAQSDGKPILIEITAPWCPTCKAQKPILERLAAQPKFKVS